MGVFDKMKDGMEKNRAEAEARKAEERARREKEAAEQKARREREQEEERKRRQAQREAEQRRLAAIARVQVLTVPSVEGMEILGPVTGYGSAFEDNKGFFVAKQTGEGTFTKLAMGPYEKANMMVREAAADLNADAVVSTQYHHQLSVIIHEIYEKPGSNGSLVGNLVAGLNAGGGNVHNLIFRETIVHGTAVRLPKQTASNQDGDLSP